MLVGPGGVETRSVSHAEDGIGTHEIPRIYGGAIVVWVANQFQRVDGVDTAVAVSGADAVDPIQELLILVDTFVVLGSCAVRYPRSAGTASNSISSRDRRR